MEKGIIKILSNYGVDETIDRLISELEKTGIHIFLRIDHKANAFKIGIEIKPAELVIFGKPQIGIALIRDNPDVALDLPMKALAWEDDKGNVWLTYNDPIYIASRHDLTEMSMTTISKMSEMLSVTSEYATHK
jgi:uncharacterized protein (DUF302 family)